MAELERLLAASSAALTAAQVRRQRQHLVVYICCGLGVEGTAAALGT
jgi:hypothetical protein